MTSDHERLHHRPAEVYPPRTLRPLSVALLGRPEGGRRRHRADGERPGLNAASCLRSPWNPCSSSIALQPDFDPREILPQASKRCAGNDIGASLLKRVSRVYQASSRPFVSRDEVLVNYLTGLRHVR